MLLRSPLVFLALTFAFFQFATGVSAAQAPARLCNPTLSSAVVVATPAQRLAAGAKAEPPLTDTFDLPDTANGHEFFWQRWRRALPADVARALGWQQQVWVVYHYCGHAG